MAQIAVINLTDVIKFGRFDADFFRADYLELRHRLEEIKAVRLEELLSNKVVTGHTPPMGEPRYYGDSVKFIKTDNLRENVIVDNFNHFLSVEGNERIKRSSLKEKDIIVTIIGASKEIVGRAALIEKDLLPANINQNIALIRVDGKKVAPEFLNVYLNTKSGRKYLHHLSRQTEQVNLNCREVEDLLVPVPDPKFQEKIVELITNSNAKKGQSKSLYAQAEQLLLQELGLEDFTPEWVTGYETDFDNILEVARMDAEYFQPRYEIVKDKIRAVNHDTLGNLVKPLKKGIEVGSEAYTDEGIPFLRVSNIEKLRIDNSSEQYIEAELYEELKDKFCPKKGEILLSKDGTPGIAYHLTEDVKTIISGGIVRLKTVEIEPEYLTLVLNSLIVQAQIEQDAGGALIKHWRPDQIKTTLIPILPKVVREKIVVMVQESFSALLESRQLLEQAKREVEEMIKSKATDTDTKNSKPATFN